MPEIEVNGVFLYYEEHGSGEAILGLHGTGSSAAAWADAAAELATRGRAIVYDRRGFARSAQPEPFVSDIHVQADDAAALLEALGAAPAIVIGRSTGADIALDLALRHPDRVRALALLEGGEMLSDAGRPWLEALVARTLAAPPEDVPEVLIDGVLGEGAWQELPEGPREMLRENTPGILAELRGGFLKAEPAALAAIDVPTLLVTAWDSVSVYAQVTADLAGLIPGAKVAEVDGDHFIYPAEPVILAFVDDVLAGISASV